MSMQRVKGKFGGHLGANIAVFLIATHHFIAAYMNGIRYKMQMFKQQNLGSKLKILNNWCEEMITLFILVIEGRVDWQ